MLKYDYFAARRSVRKYNDEIIPLEQINELLRCGISAASGSNEQPWGFVLIQDKKEISRLNDLTKKYVKENLHNMPYLAQYEKWLDNPAISLFNNASNLLLIYGNTDSHWYKYDCSMVAGNIMLAASNNGLGTCWIGFAEQVLDTVSFKEQYKVPQKYSLVCAMTLGYPVEKAKAGPDRKEPVIFNL